MVVEVLKFGSGKVGQVSVSRAEEDTALVRVSEFGIHPADDKAIDGFAAPVALCVVIVEVRGFEAD